jgi:hypothetical protein
MKLSQSKKIELFEKFKQKDKDKLLELSIRFKANKNYEKAEIVDLLREIKSQDKKGLKTLLKEFKKSDQWQEYEYAEFLLKKITTKRKHNIDTKTKGQDRIDTEPKFNLSPEVYEAMASKIKIDSERHRKRIRNIVDTESKK